MHLARRSAPQRRHDARYPLAIAHAEFDLRVGQSGRVDRRRCHRGSLFYAIIYTFPNARKIAMQQGREAIEQKNRAFCEAHGMPFGTREHTVCAEDLMDIRATERQRTLDWMGIF